MRAHTCTHPHVHAPRTPPTCLTLPTCTHHTRVPHMGLELHTHTSSHLSTPWVCAHPHTYTPVHTRCLDMASDVLEHHPGLPPPGLEKDTPAFSEAPARRSAGSRVYRGHGRTDTGKECVPVETGARPLGRHCRGHGLGLLPASIFGSSNNRANPS